MASADCGPYALLVPLALVMIGARRFQRMHRRAGSREAGVTRARRARTIAC